MAEIDSEELVSALEVIVKKYGSNIAPYALNLCDELVKNYTRLAKSDFDDDDGEGALAAVGCVTAIRRIIDSVKTNQPLIREIEQRIWPLL